jgi:uncharacterized coiled-coil DUF342 family protein
MDVRELKARCDMYERMIKDLQSRYDTHQRALDMHRKEIVGIQDHLNTLDTTYDGERYELMP